MGSGTGMKKHCNASFVVLTYLFRRYATDEVLTYVRMLLYTSQNHSPLHFCAFFGLVEICQILLQAGFDVDALEDTYQQTPLVYACRNGNDVIAGLLLDKGADPNHVSALQRGPLLEAIEADKTTVFDLLLQQRRLDVNLLGNSTEARTPLVRAAELGRLTMLEKLLVRSDILVNKTDNKGCTALSRAVQNLNIGCVKALLECDDLDVTVADTVGNRTALGWTAEDTIDYGSLSSEVDLIATTLLADTRKPIVSNVALTLTIGLRRPQLLRLYLAHVPDLSFVDEHGQSFLHIAATAGDRVMLELVLEKLSEKAPYAIDTPDKYKATALHSACRHMSVAHIGAVKYLLSKKALVTIKDIDGFTAPRRAFCAAPALWDSHVRVLFKELPDAELVYNDTTSTIDSMFQAADLTSLRTFLKTAKYPLDPALDQYTGYNFLHRIIEDDEQTEVVRSEFLELLLPHCGHMLDALTAHKQNCGHLAALQNSLPSLKLLIKASLNLDFLNVKDCYGMTTFETAQMFERDEICVHLATVGADLPPVEHIKPEVLHMAVQQKDLKAIQRLVDIGVGLYHRQRGSLLTPLQQAEEALRAAEEDFKQRVLAKQDAALLNSIEQWRKAKTADPEVQRSEAIVEYLAKKQKWSERPSHPYVEPLGLAQVKMDLSALDGKTLLSDFLKRETSKHSQANSASGRISQTQREKQRAMLELQLREIELKKQMMELDITEVDDIAAS